MMAGAALLGYLDLDRAIVSSFEEPSRNLTRTNTPIRRATGHVGDKSLLALFLVVPNIALVSGPETPRARLKP